MFSLLLDLLFFLHELKHTGKCKISFYKYPLSILLTSLPFPRLSAILQVTFEEYVAQREK